MEAADLGAGGHRRLEDLRAQRAAGVDHGLAAVQPDRPGERGEGVVGDGHDDQLDLLDEGLRLGERARAAGQPGQPLAPARDRGWPPPGPASRRGSGPGPGRPRPPRRRRCPVVGRSPGSACWWGWACPSAWTSSPWRWWPGGTGSRSMPAASMAASVSARSRSGSSPGSEPQAFTRASPRRGGGRGTIPRSECSEPCEVGRGVIPGSLRRTCIPRSGPPGRLSTGRAGRPDGLGGAARHGPHPARERPAPRRRPDGRCPRGRDPGQLAPGRGRRGRGPVHALARDPPGLHRRARHRRPRGHARRDGRPGRRSDQGQPARPGRPGHRPQRAGRPVRDVGRLRLQRRARVRAQRRALPAPALGPDRLP